MGHSRSGVPAGFFNLVCGSGRVVGETIVNSKDVDAISFTGSVETGHHILMNATRRHARVQLEMGGKNPLVVLDDATLDVAVDCAVQGAFYSTGQRCTASSRLIVTEKIHDAFVDGVMKRLEKIKVGDAILPETESESVV